MSNHTAGEKGEDLREKSLTSGTAKGLQRMEVSNLDSEAPYCLKRKRREGGKGGE